MTAHRWDSASSGFFVISLTLAVSCCCLASRRGNPSSSSTAPLVFPGESESYNNVEATLMKTAGVRNATEVLALLGIEDDHDPIAGRKKANYAEQAVCEPELTTIPVSGTSSDGSEVYFPKCVRVPRCGGCCDISDRMQCTPTKISQREIKQAKIRIRRSATPAATSQTVKVEVHEECRCMCKIKEEDCIRGKHEYQADLCKCSCVNSQDEINCRSMAPRKIWDNNSCSCKCRDQTHCPSGTFFSNESCSFLPRQSAVRTSRPSLPSPSSMLLKQVLRVPGR